MRYVPLYWIQSSVVGWQKGDQHHDESVTITNPETIALVSRLLMVKERTLVEALTMKKTVAGDETVVMTHRMEHVRLDHSRVRMTTIYYMAKVGLALRFKLIIFLWTLCAWDFIFKHNFSVLLCNKKQKIK